MALPRQAVADARSTEPRLRVIEGGMIGRTNAVELPPHRPFADGTEEIGHALTHSVVDPGVEPLVNNEIAHHALTLHAGHMRVLGDLLDPALPEEARLALIAADRAMYERISRQQREELEEAHLGTLATLQELWGHEGVGTLTHVRNLREALVEARTEAYIQDHYVGRTDFLALDPEDQEMFTEVLGREAPLFTTFNRQGLNAWMNDPAQAGLRNQLIDLCGQSPFGSREGMALMAYLFEHPEAIALLTAEHGAVLGGDVGRIQAEVTALEGHFTAAQGNRNAEEAALRTEAETVSNYETAFNLLNQILDAENQRLLATRRLAPLRVRQGPLATSASANPTDPNLANQLARLDTEIATVEGTLFDAISKSNTARRNYARFGNTLNVPSATPLGTFHPQLRDSPPHPASEAELTDHINRIVNGVNAVAAAPGVAAVAAVPAIYPLLEAEFRRLKDAHETRQRQWDASKDLAHPFNDTTDPPPGPLRAAGFANFQELQTQLTEARGRLGTAIRSRDNRRNDANSLLSPAELLRRLTVRALRRDQPLLMDDEVAQRALVETATILHLSRQGLDETATTRAVTRAAIYDRLPGLTLGQRARRARNRRNDRHQHRSFDEFKEDVLVKDERFSKIPMDELTPDTELEEITEWVGEDDHSHLTAEQLWALKTVLEHAYKGHLRGEGQLEFDVDLRPLIQRLTTAYATARMRQTLQEQGDTPNHANALNSILQSMRNEPADVRHTSFLDRVSSKIEKFLASFRSEQEGNPEDAEGQANLARMESTLERARRWGPAIADLVMTLELLRSRWRERKLAKKITGVADDVLEHEALARAQRAV